MHKTQAVEQLKKVIRDCTDEQYGAVKTMMEIGAGLMGLPEGAHLTAPVDVQTQRRDVLASLTDAIYDCAAGDDFPMPRAGGWEYVIATLVIERDWETIDRTAADLRTRHREH